MREEKGKRVRLRSLGDPYESAAIHAAIREHFVVEHLSFERAIDEYVGLRGVRDGHFFKGNIIGNIPYLEGAVELRRKREEE